MRQKHKQARGERRAREAAPEWDAGGPGDGHPTGPGNGRQAGSGQRSAPKGTQQADSQEWQDRQILGRLERCVIRGETKKSKLDKAEVEALPDWHRRASTLLMQAEARGKTQWGQRSLDDLRQLVARADRFLNRTGRKRSSLPEQTASQAKPQSPAAALLQSSWKHAKRAWNFLMVTSPQVLRSEWKLLVLCLSIFYGLAALAYVLVQKDLELAFSLYDEASVTDTIQQLRDTAPGEPFRGNFTFGLGESPNVAGWILAHNIAVSVLFFGAALFPPLFLFVLATNALMLGTYTSIAAHWDQAGAISSILWCHGVIELQMIVLSGLAGLTLVRASLAPGARTRKQAIREDRHRAWALWAPVPAFLFVSGLIEGFVSPHASFGVRMAFALGSVVLLVLWFSGGRADRRTTGSLQPSP